MGFHDEMAGTDNHGPFARVFADAAARAADAVAYEAHQSLAGGTNPIRALQLDDASEWYLADHSPIDWQPLGATAMHGPTHEDGGSDELDITTLGGFPGGTVDFLRADGTFAAPPGAGSVPNPHQLFGNGGVAATTTTRYLTPGYIKNNAPTSPVQFRVLRAGTFRRLRVRHNSPAGNGNNIVYTLRANGSGGSLAVTMASTDADGSDLANTLVVAAGDLIDLEVTKASGIGSSPSDIMASVEFTL